MNFHKHQSRLATVTAVRPPASFGVMESRIGLFAKLDDKRQANAGWINRGRFVLEWQDLNFINDGMEPVEIGALPRPIKINELP